MHTNTFSAAARTALSKLRDSSRNEEDRILNFRRNGMEGEVYGKISLASEETGPSTPNVYFVEELGIRIETSGDDFVTQNVNRSCNPNCGLRPFFGRKSLFAAFVHNTRDAAAGEQLTLPFNKDWQFSDVPLRCGLHQDGDCPMEMKRQKLAAIRATLHEMGVKKCEDLQETIQRLMKEMERTGKNTGKIVVSEGEIYIGMGKKKMDLAKAAETPKIVSVDAATQTDPESANEPTPEQYSSYF